MEHEINCRNTDHGGTNTYNIAFVLSQPLPGASLKEDPFVTQKKERQGDGDLL